VWNASVTHTGAPFEADARLCDHRGVRPRVLETVIATALVLSLATGCGSAHPGRPLALGPVASLPRSATSHVIVMVMENEESSDIVGNPAARYANALIRRYGLATRSFAVSHPSLPNYLALTSGSTHGIASDCTECGVDAANIVDQLEAARISWKAYLEDEPSTCFPGAGAGGYAKKHNPFIHYADIAGSPRRCGHLVGFTALASDLSAGTLPTYAWISPNLCDDGHDCGVAGGDRFLARTVPALLHELGPHGFLIVTWDEGSSDRGCCGSSAHGGHIATILAGAQVRRGARESTPVDHYGVLATVEEALGLPLLSGAGDPRSGRLTELFASPPYIPLRPPRD
jgi:phosphatidylinositol-3-phosphatase